MSFPSGFGSFPYWGNDPSGKYFSDEEESDKEVNDFFSSSYDHDNDVLMVDTDASSSTSKQTTIEIDLSQSGEEEEEEEAIAVSPPFTSELPSEDNALIIDEKKE